MPRVIQKSIYGSVSILKGYCNKCKENAFILDGKFSCCENPVDNIPEKEKIKRETEGESKRSQISKKTKEEILKKQENKCIYCEYSLDNLFWNKRIMKYVKLRTHIDHFISWNYSRDNKQNNLYASCHICNGIKSDKYFYDLISAREYINEKREKKGY